jgi:hypothetical protein
MTKNRSNKKSRNKYKVSGGVGGRGGRGVTNNKKTRPLGGRRRRNRSQNQEGGMKYRTMLEKDVGDINEMGLQISKIIPRLFAGLYASWGARNPDTAEVGQAYTYADIGGSLTHNGGNKFILKTRAGLNGNQITKNLSDYVLYSDWYVYELQPTPDEIAAYKKLSNPSDGSVWKGKLTKSVWDGDVATVNTALTTIRAEFGRPGQDVFGQVAYSIITSTTLSRDTITAPEAIKNASHTLLYTACRSPRVTPEMIIMLIGHGCNVNQPNGAVRFTADRDPNWASGANLTPIWGLVKCIFDISRMKAPDWSEEKINNFKRCLAALSGANQNWRDDQGLTISEWLTQQETTERVTVPVPPEFNLSMMGRPSDEALLADWKKAEKTNEVQYYRHDDGGTTYQRPDKELNLSLNPTPIAAAAAAAKSAADKSAAAAATTGVAASSAVAAAPLASSAAPGSWTWENDDGSGLVPFAPRINAALERALTEGRQYITIITKILIQHEGTFNWLFDMQAKNQTNIETGSRRSIQRKPDIAFGPKIPGLADGTIVTWYIDDVITTNPNSAEIEATYNLNKKATAANIHNTGLYNFEKMVLTKGKSVMCMLTRVCFNPLETVVTAAATAFAAFASKGAAAAATVAAPSSSSSSSSAAAAASKVLSVDDFCTMAYMDNADDLIINALDAGKLSHDDGFVNGTPGTGNTALYCACRSSKTTIKSIERIVNGYIKNVNKQNRSNGSTPLHGLVQRFKDVDSNVSGIIAIMECLITKKADRTLANNVVVEGGTALQEFNYFKDHEKGKFSTEQVSQVNALLTPTDAEIMEAAKDAFHDDLCTNLQVKELGKVIEHHYRINAKTWTPLSKGANGNNTWKKYIEGVMVDLTDEHPVISASPLNSRTRTFKPKFADISDVVNVGTMLRATTVGDIEKEYLRFFELAKPSKKASFTIVGPFIDGKYALKSKLARNGIMQVASQFDFLEAPTSAYTEIMGYPWDPTQGPGSSMASLEALILRDAAIKPPTHGGELQKLGQQPIFNGIRWYKNGYLEPHKEAIDAKLRETAAFITDNIGKLKILAQESVPEFSIDPCVQVFSAAPSYQSYHDEKGLAVHVSAPTEGSAGAQICEVLVLAQYASIAKLAVIKSIAEPSKRVNLHLTGVGQGAFNNPPSLFNKFIEEVWKIVEPFNVSVYMHVYGAPTRNPDNSLNFKDDNPAFVDRADKINLLFDTLDPSAKTASGKLPQLTAEQFINHA